MIEHVGSVDHVERSLVKRKMVSVVDLHRPVLLLKSLHGRSRPPFQVDGNDVAARGSEQSSLKPAAATNLQNPRAGRKPAFHERHFLTPNPLVWCFHRALLLQLVQKLVFRRVTAMYDVVKKPWRDPEHHDGRPDTPAPHDFVRLAKVRNRLPTIPPIRRDPSLN